MITDVQAISNTVQWDAHVYTPAPKEKVPEKTIFQKIQAVTWTIFHAIGAFFYYLPFNIWRFCCEPCKVTLELCQNTQILTARLWRCVKRALGRLLVPPWKGSAVTESDFDRYWRAEPVDEKHRAVRACLSATKQTVMTPDGAPLNVLLVSHREAKEDSPVVIYFHGRKQCSLSKFHQWLFEKVSENKVPCRIIIPEYRGVGESRGAVESGKDLIMDGLTIARYANAATEKGGLGTPFDKISIYGYSLGGFVAAHIAAYLCALNILFKGPIVIDRSLSSLEALAEKHLGHFWGARVAKFINSLGYTVETTSVFNKLSCKKMIVFHPKDPVMVESASLHETALAPAVFLTSTEKELADAAQTGHTVSLALHKEAANAIFQFLFNIPPRGIDLI